MKYSVSGLPSRLRLSELLTKTEALLSLCKAGKFTSSAEKYVEIQEGNCLCRQSLEGWMQILGSPASCCSMGIMKAGCNSLIQFVEIIFFNFFFFKLKKQPILFKSFTLIALFLVLQNAASVHGGKDSGATGGKRGKPICRGVKSSS